MTLRDIADEAKKLLVNTGLNMIPGYTPTKNIYNALPIQGKQYVQQGLDRASQTVQQLPQIAQQQWGQGQIVTQNPLIPQQLKQPLATTLQYTSAPFIQGFAKATTAPFRPINTFEKIGDIAGGIGQVTNPFQSIGMGAFQAGTQALGNIINKKPITTNLNNAYQSGFEFGAKLSAISNVANIALSPILNKVAPVELKNINTYLDLAKRATTPNIKKQILTLAAKRIIQSIGREAISGGVGMAAVGATMPTKNIEERIKNILDQGIQGAAYGAGMKTLGIGTQALGGQVIKPAIEKYKSLTPKQKQGGYINFGLYKNDTQQALIDTIQKQRALQQRWENTTDPLAREQIENQLNILSGQYQDIAKKLNLKDIRQLEYKGGQRAVESKPLKKSFFGTIWDKFTGKPKEAIQQLLEAKEGEVPAAMNKRGLGTIDFVYGVKGKGGYGISHIEETHPGVLKLIPDIIDKGNIVKSSNPDRVYIQTPDHRAVVRLDWNKQTKRWLMTAFDFEKNLAPSSKTSFSKTAAIAKDSGAMVDTIIPQQVKGVEEWVKPSVFQEKPQVQTQQEILQPKVKITNPNQQSVVPQTKAETPQGLSGGASNNSSGSIIPPKEKPFYNVERMGVNKTTKKEVLDVIDEVTPSIQKVVGKKLTHKEVIETAKRTKTILQGTIGRDQTEQLGAMALNLRNKLAYMAKTDMADEEFINLLIQDKAYGQQLARLLGQRRIVSDPSSGSLVNKIIANVLKNNNNTDDILKAAKGVDFNDMKQATAFYRQFIKPKAGDWIDLLRYNSMLSSPNTHINNSFSNLQGTGFIAPIEKTITGGLDFLSSKITGRPRQYLAGEGIAYAKGYWGNLRNAANKFMDVIKGQKISDMQEVYDIPLSTGGRSSKYEKILGFVTKALKAEDEFFQTLTEGGATSALKYRQSKNIKITGDIAETAFKEGRKRLFNAPFNLPEEGYVLKAIEYLPEKIMKARNSDNPLVSTISKFTFPFVRIPANILKASVEYSPTGVTTLWGAKNKTEQLSKAILGTGFGLGTAMLVGADRMTWSEPTSETRKNAFRDAGMQPYSIKIGDKWVSYSKLHPAIAFPIALVAAVRDAEANKRLDDGQVETILTGLAKWMQFYADASYVKNIGDFVASTKGDVQGLTRYISNYPQQLIPFRALMGWVNRFIDPYQRQADKNASPIEKQIQQIMTQLPFLSMTVPARTNKFGEPIKMQNPTLNNLSPIKITTENPEKREYYDMLTEKSKQTRIKNDIKRMAEEGKPIPDMMGVQAAETITNTKSYIEQEKKKMQNEVALERFKMSDQSIAEIGGRIYIKDENGDISSKKKTDYQNQLRDAQYTLQAQQLKAQNDIQGWIQATETYLSDLKKQKEALTGQYDEVKKTQLQNKIEDLTTSLSKYKNYNGFTKSKKLKSIKITSKKVTVPKTRISLPKSTFKSNIKIKKPPKIKLTKPKKLSNIKVKVPKYKFVKYTAKNSLV
jgi:hypothetical protein